MENSRIKKIWIAFVDDWELSGEGFGNVINMQYKTALKLMDLYKRLGVKATFNVEVMQQLAFEKYADRYREIKVQRDYWITTVEMMRKRGFDIQLHIHPQWHNAVYDGKSWKLDKRWNITSYSEKLIENFVKSSIEYLNSNFPSYYPVSFRGCEWGVCCPSYPLFKILENYGIKLDISVVNGLYFNNNHIKLDYTNLESPFLPYFPDYNDARRISKTKTKIIEIPTQSFYRSWGYIIKKAFMKIKSGKGVVINGHKSKDDKCGVSKKSLYSIEQDKLRIVNKKEIKSKRKYIIMDISNLDIYALQIGFNMIIERAIKIFSAGIIPLVFVSHTKYLTDNKLNNIESSIKYVKKKYSKNIEFVTIKEIMDNVDLIDPIKNKLS